jgi:hypothetical protein
LHLIILFAFASYVLETLANIFSPDEFEEENIPEDSRDDLTGLDLPHFSLMINSVWLFVCNFY